MPHTSTSGESTILSVLAHACALFSSLFVSIIGPIAILAIADNETVKQNAREAINFQLSMLIYALVSLALCLVLIGYITLIVVAIWSFVSPIIAMIKVANNPGVAHRYGGIIHFLK
jgi:uncharacterized protein